MAFINWTSDLSVGIEGVDRQHKKLVDMINRFHEEMEKGNRGAYKDILDSLAKYTEFHFANEEEYFDKFGYVGTVAHKRAHNAFIDKLNEIRSRYEAGKMLLSIEILNFLKEWLFTHIKIEDKKYVRCFNENGIR